VKNIKKLDAILNTAAILNETEPRKTKYLNINHFIPWFRFQEIMNFGAKNLSY
jgi:hypothetical protein